MKKLFWTLLVFSACTVTKKTNTINPFQGSEAGCGNFIVFKLTEDSKEFMSVSLKAQGMTLNETQTFEIGNEPKLSVRWKKFDGDARSLLCNDLMGSGPKEIFSKEAKAGTVTVKVSKEALEFAKNRRPYQVSLIIKNVEFEGLVVDYLQIDNVNVGWLPG